MEVALRRRLAGVVDVSISQLEQRAVVTFGRPTPAFSAVEFRRAVAEADVEVLTLDVEFCGTLDADHGMQPVVDGEPLHVRLDLSTATPGEHVCLTGRSTAGRPTYEWQLSPGHSSR